MVGSSSALRRRIAGFAIATVGNAALVIALLQVRDQVEPLSIGWAFLTLVVLSASVGGLWPGVVASVIGFLSYNYFFLPPYDTFQIGQPEHVVVLFVFLGLSGLISVLLARARARAHSAELRQGELQLQQDLARALVEPVPGDGSYRLVLQIVVSRFGFRRAALLVQGDEGLEELVAVGEPGDVEGAEPPSTERLPLVVGRRSLGVVLLSGHDDPIDGEARRTLEALTDQLALVLERDRVLRAAVRAEQDRLRPS